MSEYASKMALGAVIAVVIGSIILFGLYYLPQINNASASTTSNSSTSTGEGSSPVCLQSGNSTFSQNGRIRVNTNSPALLCVEYYYYGPQPITVDTISQIQIKGTLNNQTMFQGQGYGLPSYNSNFTINASPANITIGGPSNKGEGTIVVYSFTAKPGTNGTYALDLGWIGPKLLNCGVEFYLVSGSGIPDYTFEYGCITMMAHTSSVSSLGASSATIVTTAYPPDLLVVVPLDATDSGS